MYLICIWHNILEGVQLLCFDVAFISVLSEIKT